MNSFANVFGVDKHFKKYN